MPDTYAYTDVDIREYLDREAIRDVLYRYAHAIDRCDAELLRSVYWPDAIDDHSFFVGKRDDFVTWVMPALKEMASVTQHFLGNILIRIDGNTAKVESYFQAYHRVEQGGGQPAEDLDHVGRYLDRMEKRGKEWRIVHRIAVFDYLREHAPSRNWSDSRHTVSPMTHGARNPDDPTCALFGNSLPRVPFLDGPSA